MPQAQGVITKTTTRSVNATVERLQQLAESRGLKIFAVIDHSGEAENAGLEMPETRVVLFGSPLAGTPVMVEMPLTALDLPLKVLVWQGPDHRVHVSYSSPSYLAERYSLPEELSRRLAGIEPLAEKLVAPEPTA